MWHKKESKVKRDWLDLELKHQSLQYKKYSNCLKKLPKRRYIKII